VLHPRDESPRNRSLLSSQGTWTIIQLKALLKPQICHFRVYSSAAHVVKFNPFLVSKFQPEKCGYVKAKMVFLPFMIAFEVEPQTGQKLIFDALSLRKVLISQESSRIKKPIPKDFLFEIALFLEDKKRLDFLVDSHDDFIRFRNSVEAVVKIKPILKEFKESI
jgi:hypothetical protein